jgi:hypothetical protein
MFEQTHARNDLHNPVAILDKDLLSEVSFTLRMFEICTLCGARFGIGYHGLCGGVPTEGEIGELPQRLTEILAKDHRHDRAHKRFIDLDF